MENVTGSAASWVPTSKETQKQKEEIKLLSVKEIEKLVKGTKTSFDTLKKNIEDLYKNSPNKELYDAMVFILSLENTIENLN